jgi:hypothetical protein
MLKRFKNLGTLLIVSAMALLVMGAYVYALKSNMDTLQSKNATLLTNNGKIQSANDLNNIVVIELKRELEQQNNIVNLQSTKIADIQHKKENYKRQLKTALEEGDEKSKLWADDVVPDAVVRMLNNSDQNSSANKVSKSIPALNTYAKLPSSRIFGENQPRPNELYF